ncbi:MAG: hypothetical protein ACKO5C_05905 [Ferruginibacter sp.]
MNVRNIITILLYLALIGVCFLPWTYHADVDQYFTGFYSMPDKSGKPVYGKPGQFIIVCSVFSILFTLIPKVWAKFTHLFFSGLILAYAIRCYHLYASSYSGYTPVKQVGMYGLLILGIAVFAMSMFPGLTITSKQSKSES